MIIDDKEVYCYNCRKKSLFTCRDLNKNSGSQCSNVWFEWQNRAVEREKEKWSENNGGLTNKTTGQLSNFQTIEDVQQIKQVDLKCLFVKYITIYLTLKSHQVKKRQDFN